MTPPSKPGYILLISVVMIGFTAVATALALQFLGWSAEHTAFTASEGSQALANAHTCAERALLNLRSDIAYIGRESVTLTNGTCLIREIRGSGNENRTICAEGQVGSAVQRLQIVVYRVFPSARIASWRQVGSFTACP